MRLLEILGLRKRRQEDESSFVPPKMPPVVPIYNLHVELNPPQPKGFTDEQLINYLKTKINFKGNFYVLSDGRVIRGALPELKTLKAELGVDGNGRGSHMHFLASGSLAVDHFLVSEGVLFLSAERRNYRCKSNALRADAEREYYRVKYA